MYMDASVEAMERKKICCGEKRISTGEKTKRPKDWRMFLTNDEKETRYFSFVNFRESVCAREIRSIVSMP